jgi:hypothetical protein
VESKTSNKVTFTGADAVAFGFQAYVMKFAGNVSFGLDEVRGIEGAPPEDAAWTEAHDIDLRNRDLPAT